ncbi:MAG: folate family ECF transporter S component [Clostridiales bacterium]|jgi:ECF transporter S component (folate family)|nr:folate family ECF transporter S component [Clostridiales bacterium]
MPKNDALTTNSSPYLYPWTPSYWKAAIQQTKDIKVMVTVAMLIALTVVLTIFVDIPIPLGDNLRIRFDFLAEIVFCMIGGPIIGVAGGMVGDLVGYLCHPFGAFFPGYTISAMTACLIYSLFFFRSRITIVKIAICKLLINMLVNVLLGSVWSMVIGKYGYLFYLGKSVIKNSIMLPIEIVLMILVLGLLVPIISRFGLIPKQPKKIISVI